MAVDADLMKLYRRPMNLWVEDALTSEYLNEAWREPRILFLIAGSSESVKPVVTQARANGATNVFGLIDRDFEATNEPRWANPDLRHFILRAHEMENYLLDAEAIAGCEVNNRERLAAEIQARMSQFAESLLYWMAANAVIKRIRQTCLNDFIVRPKQAELRSEGEILTYIKSSPWYQGFPGRVSEISSTKIIQDWIDDEVAKLSEDLKNGNWCRTFCGKEIFRNVRAFVYDPPVAPSVSSATHDIDLARSIARWQASNIRIPADLVALLKHIRTKVGV
jgi:hypothetical protein